MADAHANFAYGTVATAPSPASSGATLSLQSGQGALMPAVPFNATIWPANVKPLASNAEIVRVTAMSGDDVTAMTRAQEGTSAIAIAVGYQFSATITAKTLTDAELTISDGTNTQGSGTIRLSNANGVSFGLNAGILTASVAAGGGAFSAGVSNVGNTGGDTGVTGTRLVFVGSQNITLNQATDANGATISISGGAGAAGNTGFISAGGATASLGTVVFSNSNGVSFGVNGQAVTASHNGLTQQSTQPVAVSAANGSYAFSTLSFSNANGISFGTSAGSALTASHNGLTTARASNDAVGLNTAQSNVTWTVNSSGLSLDARGYAGTGTTFAGANISVSLTQNSAGLNMSASVAAPGGGGLTPVASASNGSFSFTTLGFSNANNVTFGTSAGSIITASVAAPGAAAEQNAINLLGANTAGNTTATGSTIGWSGVNLTLSGTNASQVVVSAPATSSLSATGILSISTNGSTISIGVGHTISGMILAPFGGLGGPLHFAQSSISLGQNSLYFYPVQLEDYLTIDHVRMPVLITNSSSAVSSGRKGETFQFGIYSRNSTNNTIYTQLYSTSYTIAASYSSNVSWAQSMITAIGNSTSYNSVTASSAGLNLSASLHGPRELIIPVSTLLPPGEYWMALAASTSSSGTVGNVLNISNLAVAHQTYNGIGLSTNASQSGFFKFMGAGTYSVTTGALPASISATQIRQLGTLPILFAATGTV